MEPPRLGNSTALTNVAVVWGAECSTDCQILWMKLNVVGKGGSHKPPKGESAMVRFDVGNLCGSSVDDRGEFTERALFQESVGKKMRE